jgi:hypothetical protein
MGKIDASELINKLTSSLEFAEECLKLHEGKVEDFKEEIDNFKYLLGLVKYEEESVGVSDFVPPKHASDKFGKADYIREDGSVDWERVPTDTLVEIRDVEGEDWKLRYFHRYTEYNGNFKYETFCKGYSSKLLDDDEEPTVGWRQCRLYEGEK